MTLPSPRALKVLQVLLVAAVAESFVHYLDNTLRFSDYVGSEPPAATAWIAAWMVAASWFLFTAAAVLGYRAFRRGRWPSAPIWLAVYSTSGLISIAHYAQISISDLSTFQNVFVFLDIALGIAIFAFACWSAWALGPARPRAAGERPVIGRPAD